MRYYDDFDEYDDYEYERQRARRLRQKRLRRQRELKRRRRKRIISTILFLLLIAGVVSVFLLKKSKTSTGLSGLPKLDLTGQSTSGNNDPSASTQSNSSENSDDGSQGWFGEYGEETDGPVPTGPYYFRETEETAEIPLNSTNYERLEQQKLLDSGIAIEQDEKQTESAQETGAAEAELSSGTDSAMSDSEKVVGGDYVDSYYAILVNVDEGTIVAQKDAKKRMVPASMTKVMTALVACENLTEEQLDDKVTITQDIVDWAYLNDATNVGYRNGDQVTVRDLLYGTMLESAGDSAMGLALYIAGSQEAFVDMMNDKVKELGLSKTTHFTNCIGIYNEDLYSTVYDMAVIMAAAMDNELCAPFLGTRVWTLSPYQLHPQGFEVSNWFIRRIEDRDTGGKVIGAKTGFVNESGSCAVSMQVMPDGTRYICCTGNTWSAWRCILDHVAIYREYAK